MKGNIMRRLNQLLIFLLYHLSRFIKKDYHMWIFGAWAGNTYSDNSKYLFEYVNSNSEIIHPVWVSKNIDVVNEVTKKGFEAYYFWSLKGIMYSLRAGVNIQTATNWDINVYPIRNSITIQLFHGIPFKKIGFDNSCWDKGSSFSDNLSFFGSIKKHLTNFTVNNRQDEVFMVSASSYCKNLCSAFRIDDRNMIITGLPRNDVFINKIDKNESIKKIRQNHPGAKVVVYMPTHRNFGNSGNTIGCDELMMVNNELVLNNIIMIYKPHFHEIERIQAQNIRFSNIVVATEENYRDPYEFVQDCDLLVTDYSSIFFDYLCIDRPIVFFAYDLEWYCSCESGLYYDYDEYVPGPICRKSEELVKTIVSELNFDHYAQKRKKVKEEVIQYNDGKNCERVYDVIMSLVEGKINEKNC